MPDAILPTILAYGPLGVICWWLLIKNDAKMDRVSTELRTVGHKIDGLTRALLADVISRETTGDKARGIAHKMLTDMEIQQGAANGNKNQS